MITTAFVKIWGELVGAVAWDEALQLASFEYDSRFIERAWDLSPIKMPISAGAQIYSLQNSVQEEELLMTLSKACRDY